MNRPLSALALLSLASVASAAPPDQAALLAIKATGMVAPFIPAMDVNDPLDPGYYLLNICGVSWEPPFEDVLVLIDIDPRLGDDCPGTCKLGGACYDEIGCLLVKSCHSTSMVPLIVDKADLIAAGEACCYTRATDPVTVCLNAAWPDIFARVKAHLRAYKACCLACPN